MNQLYPSAVDALLSGDLDLLDDPLMVQGYQALNYNAADAVRSDLSWATALATPAVPLEGRSVASRILSADPATLAELGETEALAAVLIYRSDTDALVAFIDQRPDLAPLYLYGNGGPVTLSWGGIDGRQVISL